MGIIELKEFCDVRTNVSYKKAKFIECKVQMVISLHNMTRWRDVTVDK